MKSCRVCGTGFVSVEQSNDVIAVLKVNEIEFKTVEGFQLGRALPAMPPEI